MEENKRRFVEDDAIAAIKYEDDKKVLIEYFESYHAAKIEANKSETFSLNEIKEIIEQYWKK